MAPVFNKKPKVCSKPSRLSEDPYLTPGSCLSWPSINSHGGLSGGSGSQAALVKGNHWETYEGDLHTHIKGKWYVTVDGDMHFDLRSNCTRDVQQNDTL